MALPPAEEDPWRDMGIAMDQFDFPDGKNKSRVSKIQKERESRFEERERLEALKKRRRMTRRCEKRRRSMRKRK